MVDRLNRSVHVAPDAAEAAAAVAERLVRLSDGARARRGSFGVAVSGGRTPEALFRELAGRADGPTLWPDWQLFCVDERLVPPDDPRSNLGLARRLWLAPAGFPEENVHPIPTDVPPEEAARRYEATLRTFFGRSGRSTFDAVVLGVGVDGHTASLFPGAPTLDARDRWVVAEPRPAQPPEVPRITLTLEALGHARTAIFLVCGTEKREVLARLLPGTPAPRSDLPAARVAPSESVEWFVDRDAAGQP